MDIVQFSPLITRINGNLKTEPELNDDSYDLNDTESHLNGILSISSTHSIHGMTWRYLKMSRVRLSNDFFGAPVHVGRWWTLTRNVGGLYNDQDCVTNHDFMRCKKVV